MPNRAGPPRIRSSPSICSSSALRQPASDRKRLPLATPPLARIAWISAIERALPVPPAAGISAPRQAAGHGCAETSMPGLFDMLA